MATETADLADALARARSGDETGFLELWRALQPRLLRYLRVLSCGDAEDVASETWLQVVRDLQPVVVTIVVGERPVPSKKE